MAQNAFEKFDTLQTRMQLTLEKIQNPNTPEPRIKILKIEMNQCIQQSDIMLAMASRNKTMTPNRLEQTKERHEDLKAQVHTKT